MKASIAFYENQTATAVAVCNVSASITMHPRLCLIATVNSGQQANINFNPAISAKAIAIKKK